MTDQANFDETISGWLQEAAPSTVPGRVLATTFERTRGAPQQRRWRALPETPQWTRVVPPLAAAAVVAIATVLAFNVGLVPGPGGPSTPSASPTPSPSAIAEPASPPPSGEPTPSSSPIPTAPPLKPDVARLLGNFIDARIAGGGAGNFLNTRREDFPLLYATTSGVRFDRGEFDQVVGYGWPYEFSAFKVRLFGGDTVVEQLVFVPASGPLGLEYVANGFGTDIPATSENGRPVPASYSYFGGEVTLRAAYPWLMTSIGRLIPAGTRVQPTTDGGERNDWALFQLIADPVSPSPANCSRVPGAPYAVCEDGIESKGVHMRAYVFDVPEGLSMSTFSIVVTGRDAEFDRAVQAIAPVIESVEFHVP